MVKRLIALILCLQTVQVVAQNDSLFCKQITAVQNLIDTSHYSPKPVNDSLSKGVFDLFVHQLDEEKRYFIQSDIDGFMIDAYKIDDYLTSNTCDFVDKYAETLKKRIIAAKEIIEALRKTPLDYTGKDTLYFSPENNEQYFKSEANVKSFWNKRIRHLIISKLMDEDSVFDHLKKNFKTLEAKIKPKVIDNQLCLLEEALHLNGNIDIYVKETFLNALLNYEDPNSSFFNISDKTEFEGSLSNEQLSFGIYTDKNNEGEIYISHIVPGSAAFKDGNLEENDIVKSLSSGTNVLETYCISNDDILSFINDDRHRTVTFKIKKSNGSIQNVELTKIVTKVESSAVRGYILEHVTDFGYIEIPSFYTDLESPNGLGLANDVAKELYKLNKEDIKGLIIDLRFNGGGSMKEAAELSGMFIDRGPLSIIKYPNGETYTVRDLNKGVLFKKPIVVLINSYSASASEFFASVMQDYSRAIIVGSPSHGKSSAQSILPLSESEDLGYSKITVEKFYRVTGLSHQSVGVIPDVLLPSLYENFKTNERFSMFALTNDSVEVKLKHHAYKKPALELINTNSIKRVENNLGFNAIKEINTIVANDYMYRTSEYALTLDNVYNDMNSYNQLWNDFESKMNALKTTITARNTSSTNEILQYNDDDKNANALILKDISADVYIEEAYMILLDLLNSKTTN